MLTAREVPVGSRVPIALAAMTTGGAMIALQARVNGALAERLGSAIVTALISFAVGLVVAITAVTVTHNWAAVRRLRSGERRLWWFAGGLCGAVMVASVAAAVPLIGVALLSVCLVAGQLAGALVVDLAGLAPGARRPVTAARLGAALLAVVAVGISTLGQNIEFRPGVIAWVTLAGFLSAVQQAANAHVTGHADEVLVAVLVNFVVGTAALAGLVMVLVLAGDLGDLAWPGWQLWLYTGGVMGAVFVLVTTAVVRLLGVLRIALAVVAGQLAGALLLDVLTPAAKRPSLQLYTGVALVGIAVYVAGRSRARATAAPQPNR